MVEMLNFNRTDIQLFLSQSLAKFSQMLQEQSFIKQITPKPA